MLYMVQLMMYSPWSVKLYWMSYSLHDDTLTLLIAER